MTTIREVTDGRRWNETVAQLPGSHVLQSFEWGEFKAKYGWKPTRLLFEEGSQVKAAASVLCRQLPRFPLRVMYVPKGPLLDYGDGQLLSRVLASLEELARTQRAIFIKMDPDVRLEESQVIETLRARGWRPSSEQIQFRNTILIDLRPGEDELLASMKAKTRYNIRLAARRGVKVRVGGPDDLPGFHEMYAETGRRDDFIIRPFAYYRDAWGAFIEAGLACLFLAEYEGEPLARLIAFRFGQRAWYMYGASTEKHRNLMPNHLLQWEAIRWAKGEGCTVYDLWGAPDVLSEDDPLWGVYRFKEGFGGQFVRHIGAYDYPVSRPIYGFYTVLMPRYLDLLRARHRRWGF
ncbi:MAG: peptidoglycan bridge formation glycyltransferase FemA/FemB family protein [Anaerolineales bacterium]|nr:MAG: peptidoglycan bridge formation glycyltransferase FemA/FemB family protein [Anaerolineales bacterium]